MINYETIKSELISVVGWRQQQNIDLPQLSEMLTSDSGRYFQGFHSLLNLDTITSIAPDFDLMTFEAYDTAKTYPVDYFVQSGADYYRSLQANNLNNPVTDTAFWVKTTPFTNWVRNKTIDGIGYTLDMWLLKKFKRKTAKNLLENDTLFKTAGSIADTRQKQGKRVGFVIVPTRAQSLKTTVGQIGLQFVENVNLEIKLFKSDQMQPIWTETFTYTGAGSTQWFTPKEDTILEPEKAYYLVYDEDSLTATNFSINGLSDYDFYGEGGYHTGSLIQYYPSGKYFNVASFSTNEDFAQLWDIRQNTHTLSTNYGMNLKVSTECDYTDFIIDNKLQFTPAIGYGVALQFLTESALNPNAQVNRHQRNAEEKTATILYERDGEKGKGGIEAKFWKTLEMLAFDLSAIDPVCLPCKKNGVRHGSM